MSSESEWVMFVDDLLLYRPISRPSEFLFVQDGNIEDWSIIVNYLTFNLSKCKYIM